ncbi:MAG: DUF815 domain-containing protein [Lamprobacter sp.]|nr:DUF815 domain-containing protein [Lamprobacter sp.]MEA3640084.1 DUF815 domain-containing protein [Lamprobacter sp.]
MIYATSNRRHLLPEYQRWNQEAQMIDGEIHQGEGVERRSRSPIVPGAPNRR